MPKDVDYLFKICFLGEPAVGKTSLVGRYVYDSFEGNYLATIGTHIHVKTIQIGDTRVKLVIWDIAGQDDFAGLRKAYYLDSAGAFFVFDTTRPETLDRIDAWIDTLFAVAGPIPVVLVENKTDLPSQMPAGMVESVANRYGFSIVRTSAKVDVNVETAFEEMTTKILERARQRPARHIQE